MAGFGPVAVGWLTGRLHGGADSSSRRCSWATMLTFAALSAMPDADVIVVALGAPDRGAIGHRGASHSLCIAVAIGVLCALVARRLGWPVLRTAIAGTLAVASHGILDAFGEGGRGIPLLWPFSEARYMSPWRLLPDAPRGIRLLSRPGLVDLALEFTLFLPLTAAALWPARPYRPRLVTPLATPAVAPVVPPLAQPLVPIDGEGGAQRSPERPASASAPLDDE